MLQSIDNFGEQRKNELDVFYYINGKLNVHQRVYAFACFSDETIEKYTVIK